jgi:hypothetical protein
MALVGKELLHWKNNLAQNRGLPSTARHSFHRRDAGGNRLESSEAPSDFFQDWNSFSLVLGWFFLTLFSFVLLFHPFKGWALNFPFYSPSL